jgi:hypothetical protein
MTQQANLETEQLLLALADNMASAATTFSGQGYQSFLQARDEFKETLHNTLSDMIPAKTYHS